MKALGDKKTVDETLDDPANAPISPRVRAMLGVLRKMTLDPAGLGAADIRPLLAVGISREEIRDAMYVAFLFNTLDRLADTLGWDIPPEEAFQKGADRLLRHGYNL